MLSCFLCVIDYYGGRLLGWGLVFFGSFWFGFGFFLVFVGLVFCGGGDWVFFSFVLVSAVSSLGRECLWRSVCHVPMTMELLCCLYLFDQYDYAGSWQLSCICRILQLNTWRYYSGDIYIIRHLDGRQEL